MCIGGGGGHFTVGLWTIFCHNCCFLEIAELKKMVSAKDKGESYVFEELTLLGSRNIVPQFVFDNPI